MSVLKVADQVTQGHAAVCTYTASANLKSKSRMEPHFRNKKLDTETEKGLEQAGGRMSGRNVCSVVRDETEKSGYGWADGTGLSSKEESRGKGGLGFQSLQLYGLYASSVARQGVQQKGGGLEWVRVTSETLTSRPSFFVKPPNEDGTPKANTNQLPVPPAAIIPPYSTRPLAPGHPPTPNKTPRDPPEIPLRGRKSQVGPQGSMLTFSEGDPGRGRG
ncbi:hypothetical protein B0T20DRAFT_498162 [Sordaria brevicollis]|uniref:Uncharacterized protein n=1 Tax=Sordaria brevicollis TaxID=83679 RepID=A0AAE0UBT5_SORBR|nr:hypothetical protein B0T20DRAFT_498162 [Sordaria brevicollis]